MKLEPINPDLFEAADAERENAPAEEEVLPYMGDPNEDHAPKIKVDDRPAQVRTAELFDFEPRFIYLPKPQARPGILSSIKR